MARNYTLRQRSKDRHQLYQWSVQDAEWEVEFIEEQYAKRRGRSPRILREDFCGTALVASQWVKGFPERRSIGLDLDQETLDWGAEHNVAPLKADADRVDLRLSDVRTVTDPKADIVAATNFSYSVFTEVAELTEYFRAVYRSMAPGGMLMLDCYGGWESQQVLKESRKVKCKQGTFGYIWHQAKFNPINNRILCHIHFEFKGGKRWKKAFTYDWRLYSPAEVRDLLYTAGFSNVEVFWDHEEDEDASDFRPTLRAENSAGWIAYILADGPSLNGNGRS